MADGDSSCPGLGRRHTVSNRPAPGGPVDTPAAPTSAGLPHRCPRPRADGGAADAGLARAPNLAAPTVATRRDYPRGPRHLAAHCQHAPLADERDRRAPGDDACAAWHGPRGGRSLLAETARRQPARRLLARRPGTRG